MKQHNRLREVIGSDDLATYDSDNDAFIFPAGFDEEPDVFASITENGRKYYPIGAFCWIWEEKSL